MASRTSPAGPTLSRRALNRTLLARQHLLERVARPPLEVVEHVPDPGKFIAACAALVRPGGLLILSTINRTLKAYALAIVGAEYLMGWLPRGTHQWERFVTPDVLANHLGAAGCTAPTLEGLVYDPFGDQWTAGADLSVNYMAAAAKPAVR